MEIAHDGGKTLKVRLNILGQFLQNRFLIFHVSIHAAALTSLSREVRAKELEDLPQASRRNACDAEPALGLRDT